MIIYGAVYNMNRIEKDDELLSLHKTKKGADDAISKDKQSRENEIKEFYNKIGQEMSAESLEYYNKYSMLQEWSICEYELLD